MSILLKLIISAIYITFCSFAQQHPGYINCNLPGAENHTVIYANETWQQCKNNNLEILWCKLIYVIAPSNANLVLYTRVCVADVSHDDYNCVRHARVKQTMDEATGFKAIMVKSFYLGKENVDCGKLRRLKPNSLTGSQYKLKCISDLDEHPIKTDSQQNLLCLLEQHQVLYLEKSKGFTCKDGRFNLDRCMIKIGNKYQCITRKNFGIKWTDDLQFCDEFSKDPASKMADYKNFLEDCNVGLMERSAIISTPLTMRTTTTKTTMTATIRTTGISSKLQYSRPVHTRFDGENYHTERQKSTFTTTAAPSASNIISFNQRSKEGEMDFSNEQYRPAKVIEPKGLTYLKCDYRIQAQILMVDDSSIYQCDARDVQQLKDCITAKRNNEYSCWKADNLKEYLEDYYNQNEDGYKVLDLFHGRKLENDIICSEAVSFIKDNKLASHYGVLDFPCFLSRARPLEEPAHAVCGISNTPPENLVINKNNLDRCGENQIMYHAKCVVETFPSRYDCVTIENAERFLEMENIEYHKESVCDTFAAKFNDLRIRYNISPETCNDMSRMSKAVFMSTEEFKNRSHEDAIDPDYYSYEYKEEYDNYSESHEIENVQLPALESSARPKQPEHGPPKQYEDDDQINLPDLDPKFDPKYASNQNLDSSKLPHGLEVPTHLESIKPTEQDVSVRFATMASNQGANSYISPTYSQSRPQSGAASNYLEPTPPPRYLPVGTGSHLTPIYNQPGSQSGDGNSNMRPMLPPQQPSVGGGTPHNYKYGATNTYQPDYQVPYNPIGKPGDTIREPIAAVPHPNYHYNSPTQYGSHTSQQTAHASSYGSNGASPYLSRDPYYSAAARQPQEVPVNQVKEYGNSRPNLPVYQSSYVPLGYGYQPSYANPYEVPPQFAAPNPFPTAQQYEPNFSAQYRPEGFQQPYRIPHQHFMDERYPNVGLRPYIHHIPASMPFNPSLGPAYNQPGLKPPPPPGASRNTVNANNYVPYQPPQPGSAYRAPNSYYTPEPPVIDYELFANPTLCNLTKIDLPEKCVNLNEFIKEFGVLPIDDMISKFDNKSAVDHIGDIYTAFKDVPIEPEPETTNSPRKLSTDSAKALFNVANKLKNMDTLRQCNYLVENSKSHRVALCPLIKDCRLGPLQPEPVFCSDE